MRRLLLRSDDVLRRKPWTAGSSALRSMPFVVLVFGMIYGAAMGSYGGFWGDRSWQVLYAAVKVPLMLLATFLISLPSYYVVNTLLGLRRDFAAAMHALLATQAGLAIILASLAPLTVVWNLSCDSHDATVLFNGAMFAVATFAAQSILRAHFRSLAARNGRHRWMLRFWAVVFSFVGIQMGWVLRPFVGELGKPIQFFREESWSNAYVTVLRLLWQMVSH